MTLTPRAEEVRVDDSSVPPPVEVASILMVDDHPANLLALEAVLAPLGHRLVAVNSGREALKELLHSDFAVILLDVQMADMDGFETASLIKAHTRTASIPLIFVTALSRDAENIFTGYARGGVDYLLKPIDPDILRSKVSVFIELYLRGQKIRAQQAFIGRQELARLEARHGRRFRKVLEAMPLPVWGTRVDGKVYFAGRAWTEYSGRHVAEGADLVEPDLVHTDDLAALRDQWTQAVLQQTPFALECRLRRHDGAFRWHVFRAVAEYGEGGRIEGWIVTATDIDDHKRQDEERSRLLTLETEARTEAERANAAKDAFLATVSHELRSPLNAIVGWARLLATGQVPAERVPAALETIQRNAFAQARLVEDLLDMSRVVFGKLQLALEWTSIATIVQAAVDAVRPMADGKRVVLTHVADADGLISADAARLQQVVSNLLVNAVKFNAPGGSIDVTVTRGPGRFEIVVADTGAGIARESLPHVFDRFNQGSGSASGSPGTGRTEGLGLGLAVVEQLVTMHGGTVTAESAGLGKGATFRVRLPAPEAPAFLKEAKSTGATRSLAEAPTLDGRMILVVDDEADARQLLIEVLENRGATVVSVDSALAALAFLGGTRPDAVISDIGMPEQDGYALIREIRQREGALGRGRLPAIALTAHAYEDDTRHALSEGFELHLSKPFDPMELVLAIHGVLQPPTPRLP